MPLSPFLALLVALFLLLLLSLLITALAKTPARAYYARPSGTAAAAAQTEGGAKAGSLLVSFTTVPWRAALIAPVAEDLLREFEGHDARVVLNVPRRLKRTGEAYPPLPADLPPALHVQRVEEDLGPATKLLPSIAYAKRVGATAILLVDDDVAYKPGLLSALWEYWRTEGDSKTVFAFRTRALPGEEGPGLRILQGFGGLLLPMALLEAEGVEARLRAALREKPCFTSDDLVMSAVLREVDGFRIVSGFDGVEAGPFGGAFGLWNRGTRQRGLGEQKAANSKKALKAQGHNAVYRECLACLRTKGLVSH